MRRWSKAAQRSPGKYAAVLAGAYVIVGTLYIFFSTRIAAALSLSVEQMRLFETGKGIAYVGVTAILLFCLAYGLRIRIRRQALELARQSSVLENADRAMLAGTFASSIAHDINNALTVSTLAVSTLRSDQIDRDESNRVLADLEMSIANIADWNRRLLDIGSNAPTQADTTFDLADVAAACVRLAKRHFKLRFRDIELEHDGAAAPFSGSAPLVRRALLNLILNAAEAGGENGRVRVRLGVENGQYRLRVEDDGPGVPPPLRLRILQPYFTTKPEGTGLGLASVIACAEHHGGRVEVGDSPLGGARFDLYLKV